MNWNRGFKAAEALVTRSTWRLPNDPKHIFLDVGPKADIKTLRELLILFQLGGLNVSVRASLARRTLSIANVLEWHSNADLIWRSAGAAKPQVVCTDACTDQKAYPSAGKVIQLHYDYNHDMHLEPGEFAMPFPMHPQIYVQYHEHERLPAYRQSARRIRLLFAGNWNVQGYNNAIIGDLFGKLTRYKIVDSLRRSKVATIVERKQELDAVLAREYSNEFIIVDSNALRINQAEWLSLVSKADFFLCPPGILFPWSHNSVEAMAVGTIPLINYADWFYPPLTDGVNAITFSTRRDLFDRVAAILAMSHDQIGKLRQNVLAYYDEHLAPARFVSRLLGSPERLVHLHLWNENEDALRRAHGSIDPQPSRTLHKIEVSGG